METIKKMRCYLTTFEWFEVFLVVGFTIYFAMIDKQNPWWYLLISSVATICGIFCVVLCAAGKQSQYYWGFFNIIGYIVIAWINKYYGEVMLNALYYLPTQFVGMYLWKKHYNTGTSTVKCKKMSLDKLILFTFISGVFIWVYQIFLAKLGGNAAWLDSMSTTFSLAANALMVLRYREQWILWIIVDIITVIMWLIAGDLVMTTMWAVYLLNACYGLYRWTAMSEKSVC